MVSSASLWAALRLIAAGARADDGHQAVKVKRSREIIALSPPLILNKRHIDEMFGILREALGAVS